MNKNDGAYYDYWLWLWWPAKKAWEGLLSAVSLPSPAHQHNISQTPVCTWHFTSLRWCTEYLAAPTSRGKWTSHLNHVMLHLNIVVPVVVVTSFCLWTDFFSFFFFFCAVVCFRLDAVFCFPHTYGSVSPLGNFLFWANVNISMG